MRNWIISLIILILPMAVYTILKSNKELNSSIYAEAANKPSVIKFTSPMCTDCKKITSEIEPLKEKYKDSVIFIEVTATNDDAETQKKIKEYNVTVVPTIIFLNPTTQKEKKIEGFEKREKLEQCIKELING